MERSGGTYLASGFVDGDDIAAPGEMLCKLESHQFLRSSHGENIAVKRSSKPRQLFLSSLQATIVVFPAQKTTDNMVSSLGFRAH